MCKAAVIWPSLSGNVMRQMCVDNKVEFGVWVVRPSASAGLCLKQHPEVVRGSTL